jgi:hypothetical protein
VQQINVRFLNLPEPDVTERFVSSAARAYSLARGWSEEVRTVDLAEILPPAAASMVATLLDRIAAGKVVDAEALALMASVLDALVAYRDARPILTEARRRSVEAVLMLRDSLLALSAAVAEALDIAAALRLARELRES